MRLVLTIAALLAPLAAAAQSGVINPPSPEVTVEAWLDWVPAHAPFGFDITPDGTMWINVAEVGQEDDYAIRAADLYNAWRLRSAYPTFWVRGYHKNNRTVEYRDSRTFLSLDCERVMITRRMAIYYDAKGEALFREEAGTSRYIVPGSYADEYHRRFCIERG